MMARYIVVQCQICNNIHMYIKGWSRHYSNHLAIHPNNRQEGVYFESASPVFVDSRLSSFEHLYVYVGLVVTDCVCETMYSCKNVWLFNFVSYRLCPIEKVTMYCSITCEPGGSVLCVQIVWVYDYTNLIKHVMVLRWWERSSGVFSIPHKR